MQAERKDCPGDSGWINGMSVVRVTRGHDRRIRHHFAEDSSARRFKLGEQVQVVFNQEVHSENSAIRLGGRLIEVIGKASFIDLRAVDASYWPNRACVEFSGFEYLPKPDSLLPIFRREIERALFRELPITTIERTHSEFSEIQIGDYAPFVCSGRYPTNLRAIEQIEIIRISAKGGSIQVRYRVSRRKEVSRRLSLFGANAES